MDHLRRRTNATKALFQGPQPTEETEFISEEEQEELIESLRISNERANLFFKTILLALSVLEIATHIAFVIYSQFRKTYPLPDNQGDSVESRKSASPVVGISFSLLSFGIGIATIRDSSRIRRINVAIWTAVSLIPLVLMIGTTEFSFELMWWSMPLLLQLVDLASLWIMKDPEEAFFQLEESQYKLKGA